MSQPVHIDRPEISDAKVLSPVELNAIRFTGKHTLLTPQLLNSIAAKKKRQPESNPQT